MLLAMAPLILLIVSFGFGVVFFVVTSGDSARISQNFQRYMPLILLVNHLLILVILLRFLRKDNLSLTTIGWRVRGANIFTEVLLGLALAGLVYCFNELIIESIQQASRGEQPEFRIGMTFQRPAYIPFFMIAISLPVIEELLYRGYAHHALQPKYGTVGSVLISSVFFGALHWGMGVLTASLIVSIGILLHVAFLARDRNLISVVTAHIAYNAMVLTLV